MSVAFESLLRKPVDDIKRPPALPAGTYHGVVEKYEMGESPKKKTPYLRFHIRLNSAAEDVDQEELGSSGINLAKKSLQRDYYITDEALFRLKDFIESCGITTTGRTLEECLPDTTGAAVLIGVKQSPTQDGEGVRNEITDLKGQA